MNHSSYIIAGPTASGKSDFAHQLARCVNGVIINCDSVQIYSGIENISASPLAGLSPSADVAIDDVPYRLFSILPLTEQISVIDYLEMATHEYNAARAVGRTPIFVGGTGYYINALLNGLSAVPSVSAINRERARQMTQNDLPAARALLPTDFTATDPQRVARALEVFFETGQHLTYWQAMPRTGAINPAPCKILINPPRDVLAARIAQRISLMLDGGALDEAREIIAAGVNQDRAIGASQLCKFVHGEITADQCNQEWITRTCQYAKRQQTWFKTQFTADLQISHVPTDADIKACL